MYRLRPAEIMVCILDIDSVGKVNAIHLFADEKNRDSTYNYLSRMNPNLFSGLTYLNCKNKSIMFTILSSGQGKSPLYFERISELYPLKLNAVEKETNKLVMISPLRYSAPYMQQ